VTEGGSGAYARASAGFMGKAWDTGETAFATEFWTECLRVLKPGGHVLAFGGTRSYHRLACAIEDAGFEIRDQVAWAYGSGFPKSHNVSKGIDKAAGAEREIIGRSQRHVSGKPDQRTEGLNGSSTFAETVGMGQFETAAATVGAEHAEGWGTALKPAWEPICLARKPLSEPTVAANVLKWGTGAINVDGCRVEGEKPLRENTDGSEGMFGMGSRVAAGTSTVGRWPANIVHDGSDDVVEAFPTVGDAHAPSNEGSVRVNHIYGADNAPRTFHAGFSDSGSAARFFYTAKANADDRLGSKHPTVKPIDLMQWLIRLVTPKGGIVLDPFAGTGTTAEAAFREGMRCVLVEREAEYQSDIRRRMSLVLAGPAERGREAIKAKMRDKPIDAGPLFAGSDDLEPTDT
jgi:DNA modification methylase